MPHLSDARSAKSPFQLTTLLGLVKRIAGSTVAQNIKPTESPWDTIRAAITQLVQEGGKLLPLAMDSENVLKGIISLTRATFWMGFDISFFLCSFWHRTMGHSRAGNQSQSRRQH